MNRFYLLFSIRRHATASLLAIVLVAIAMGCQNQNQTAQKLSQDTTTVQKVDTELTFNNVDLEQADEQGQTVWKVKAVQATYSQDQQVAQVKNPTGELFQDGKSVYRIQAQEGEVHQDGKQLFLKGQIVATDPKSGLVLRGNELEWRPQEDLLIVRNQLTGSHKQVQAVAQEARVFSRKQRVELQGKVVANTTEPATQLRTEQLTWLIPEERLIADRAIAIDRYQDKKITARSTANSGEFNLKTKIATLKENAQIALVDPPVQVASNSAVWDLNIETVTTDQPVRVVHHQEKMTMTAKRGRMDLRQQIAYLNGDVVGSGQKGQTINSQRLTWTIPTQLVEAQGNVVYRQTQPPVSFTGDKAVGKLQNESLVVSSSGSGRRVVTEIIP
ncbi:LPS export ABC transporter periplasmic protein LptC [Chroogloeocystis siderophila]|jgi:LPS export ABC transporter protein LptC|uniref:LPS export ABC transporter periplasmic protein LptC n=1 Tax=Chroogloeocystis siderophila 5.2 s.c.1 TaxID=247279 RepID=A0A1U7HYI5_9CHRO|nr:LPS export ABC transporter periplasmic protein LptC [Chroogloeocystis siderophila]OKH28718.1 LPS export ABC transporter periplasmic protein LptC [Chroogloeocystis siderophila 5.2 s.c.1]